MNKSANELLQLVRKLVPPLSPGFYKGQGEFTPYLCFVAGERVCVSLVLTPSVSKPVELPL